MEKEQGLQDTSFEEDNVLPDSEEEADSTPEAETPTEIAEEAPPHPPENEETEEERQQSTKKFISKLQRDRFRAIEEARELREKVAQLEEVTAYMNEGVLKQYEANAHLTLEKARAAKKHAIELADTDAMIQADEEISRSVAQLEHLRMLPPPQRTAYRQEASPPPQDGYYEVHPQIEQWLGENTWCDEQSPDFDPDKAAEVLAYAAALDTSLARQGRTNEYYSRDYFSRINNYARLYDQQQSSRSLTMKTPASPVAPVKHASLRYPSSRDKDRIDLSTEDREMARRLKIKEEDYLKYKKADIKEQRERGISHVYR